jgi:hypothetical protein
MAADFHSTTLQAVLRGYAASVDKRAELLAKILACFSLRHFAHGEILGVQREPVEDVFIMDTASCTMRLVAPFEVLKRNFDDSEDQKEFSRALVSRPPCKTQKVLDITSAGPMDCVGMTDFYMSGRWSASVHVTQSGSILVANRKRLFSVFENAYLVIKCIREHQEKKHKARLRRVRHCINTLQNQGLILTEAGAAASDSLRSIFDSRHEPASTSPSKDTAKKWRPPVGKKVPLDIAVTGAARGSS